MNEWTTAYMVFYNCTVHVGDSTLSTIVHNTCRLTFPRTAARRPFVGRFCDTVRKTFRTWIILVQFHPSAAKYITIRYCVKHNLANLFSLLRHHRCSNINVTIHRHPNITANFIMSAKFTKRVLTDRIRKFFWPDK